VQRLLDGQLGPPDAARLDEILLASGEAIDAYLNLMTLEIMVRQCAKANLLVAEEGSDLPVGDAEPCDGSQTVERDPHPTSPAATSPVGDSQPAVKSPVLGFLSGVVHYVSHSPKLMFWLICSGFVAYFTAQVGSLLIERIWGPNAQVAAVGGNGERHRGGAEETPGLLSGPMVARLTKAIDCHWTLTRRADGANLAADSTSVALAIDTNFAAGQQLNLTTGLAELTFASGATVILHAPANFTITDPLGGDLQLGKLVAKVPHTGAGFRINTPAGKVVDLGTEFGVNVNDDRSMHVIVYVGEVKVESKPGAAANSANSAAPAPLTVKAGEAIVIAAGQPAKHVAAKDEHFIRDLATLGSKDDVEDAYVELMKKLKPVVWFRMEGKETDRVLHDEMGGADAKLDWDGPGNPFVKGAAGKGLWLRAGPIKDRGAIVADYPQAEHDKLTVSLWAYAENVPEGNGSATVCNWDGDKTKSGQFYLGLVKRSPKAVLCVQMQPREGKAVWIEESYDHAFPIRQWQHVAFVCDGKSLRLYRQGRQVPWDTPALAGLRFPVDVKMLAIGAMTNSSGKGPTDRWSGKLDEIAVFNDALPADTIRKLAAFAP